MIDILLPVYNGAQYIEEQIESLQNQTYKNFRIIIRDDGSTDNSIVVISKLMQQYDNIELINDDKGNLGVTKCFEELITYVKNEYFMFCDQDDQWLPDKIEVTLQRMFDIERSNPGMPILVCTDSICVDVNGNVIAPSFFESQKLYDVTGNPTKMAVLNVVQGNTCLLNKSCAKYIHGMPSNMVYDDWVGVCIAHYGKVSYLKKQTLLYRQHSNNSVGANKININYFLVKLRNPIKKLKPVRDFFDSLPFELNITEFLFWKIFYTVARIFK